MMVAADHAVGAGAPVNINLLARGHHNSHRDEVAFVTVHMGIERCERRALPGNHFAAWMAAFATKDGGRWGSGSRP